jgi:hypothetical protein
MKYLLLSAIASTLTLTAAESPLSASRTTKECCPVTQHCFPPLCKATDVTYRAYGEFFYMQPNGTNMYYGASAIGITAGLPLPASIASPDWTILEVSPSFHPGFEIGTSVLLDTANIEIGANWQWLHCEDSDSFQASSAAGHMVGPFFDIGPNAGSYKIGSGTAISHFDEVDLTFAKSLCFFNDFHTRFYGAASFLRIMQSLDGTYSNVSGTIRRHVDTSSTFTAGGPQIGLDYDYRIHKGFFFSGKSSFSLFIGQMKNTTTYQSFTPELTLIGLAQPNNQATSIPNRVQTSPAFEQKLGFSYIALWDQARATFEIGYRCQVYLGAVQNFNMASQAIPDDLIATPDVGVFAVAFEQTNSNFMLSGPYLTAGVDF